MGGTPQAWEPLGPPETGKGQKDPPQELAEEVWPRGHLDSGPWDSRAGRGQTLLAEVIKFVLNLMATL